MRLYNKQDLINYLSTSDSNTLYHINPFGRLEHAHLKIQCLSNVSTDFLKIYIGFENRSLFISDILCKDGIKRTFTTKQEAEEYLDYLKSVPILKEVIDHYKEYDLLKNNS